MGRGLSDYNVISTAGGILGGMFGGPAGAAVGSGLGSIAEGDDFTEALMGGMMSFGLGSALQGLSGTADSFIEPVTKAQAVKDVAGESIFKEGTKPFNELVAKKMVGSEGITTNMFDPINADTISNIGAGVDEAGFGKFASRAIKNPKVYMGLGATGLGLAGQMEPAPIEAPEKRTYSRRPNLTEGPPRARFAPGADYAPGYDPEFDYGFAEGGIVSGNRKYQAGDLIDQIVYTNPQNPGEVMSNVGTGISVVNSLGNVGVPGLGSAVGAIGEGLAADAYQADLTNRGITTAYNAPGASERDNRNFISGPEAMLGGASFGILGDTARNQRDNIINNAKARIAASELERMNTSQPIAGPTLTPLAQRAGGASPMPTPDIIEDDTNQDDGSDTINIDLNQMPNAPSLDDNPLGLDATEENLASLMAGTGNAYNTVAGSVAGYNDIGPAVEDAIQAMRRDLAVADVYSGAVDLGDGGYTFTDSGVETYGGGMVGDEGPSMAQGGLVPGSMNQPQKRYFGIYKKGGPVRSYALGKNVDAIEEEQVQQNPIVVEAVAAITGNHPNPEVAIMQFIKMYGEEAFVALREEVVAEASSEDRQASGLGALSGPGTGLSDDIPAEVKQGGLREPAALSVGEQVVPADVVAMLGDGSTEAGSRKIDNMVDEVRMQKTGTKKQAGPLDMNRVEGMMA